MTNVIDRITTDMLNARPLSELDGLNVWVPADQSIVGANGLYIKMTLSGIPNIGKIHLGVGFNYAEWVVEIEEEV